MDTFFCADRIKMRLFRREKLINREMQLFKQLARIAVGGSNALMIRDTEVDDRYQQLHLTHQTDNGKQPNGNKDLFAAAVYNEVVKHFANALGNRIDIGFTAAATAAIVFDIHQFCRQANGVYYFYLRLRQIGFLPQLCVHLIKFEFGRKDAGIALGAKQNDLLVKGCKPFYLCRTAQAAEDIQRNFEEELQIHCKKATVEWHRFYVCKAPIATPMGTFSTCTSI